MSFLNIRAALIQAFSAGNFFPQEKTQYENTAFVPPSDSPWAAVWFLPNQPNVASLGQGGKDEVQGFLQIDLNYPLNSGEAKAMEKFEAIRAVFHAGEQFTYGGQGVLIMACGRSQGRIVNGFYKIVVTIRFYSQINR